MHTTLKCFVNENKTNDIITLYRGNGYNKNGHFYSPSMEYAMEFTESGKESELIKLRINKNKIYKFTPLPRAYGREDKNFDIAIEEAKKKGFNALWIDEGSDQPNSVFIINVNKK